MRRTIGGGADKKSATPPVRHLDLREPLVHGRARQPESVTDVAPGPIVRASVGDDFPLELVDLPTQFCERFDALREVGSETDVYEQDDLARELDLAVRRDLSAAVGSED